MAAKTTRVISLGDVSTYYVALGILERLSLLRMRELAFGKWIFDVRFSDLQIESLEFRYSVITYFTLQMSLSGVSYNAKKQFRTRRESFVEKNNQ